MYTKINNRNIYVLALSYILLIPSHTVSTPLHRKGILTNRRETVAKETSKKDLSKDPLSNVHSQAKPQEKKWKVIIIGLVIGTGIVFLIINQMDESDSSADHISFTPDPPPSFTPDPSPSPTTDPPPTPTPDPPRSNTQLYNDLFSINSDGQQAMPQVAETLTSVNPYKHLNPYKVFPIDWESSQLDPKAIDDFKADIPNLSTSKDRGKHVWPGYITMRLLGKNIYKVDQWIKIFYQDLSNTLTEDAIVKEVKATKDDIYYFHSTKSVDAMCSILASEVKIAYSGAFPGAFVSCRELAGKSYGEFTFAFKRELEFFSLPITDWRIGGNSFYTGFWDPIPPKQFLAEIFIDTRNMSDYQFNQYKTKIEATLRSKGYDPSIKVSKQSSMDNRESRKNHRWGSPIVIPKIWLSDGDDGCIFQRNQENELEITNGYRSKLYKLYKDEPLDFFKPLPITR